MPSPSQTAARLAAYRQPPSAWDVFWTVLLIGTVHRLLAWPALAPSAALPPGAAATLFVGWLGDIWLAYLFAAGLLLLASALRLCGQISLSRASGWLLLTLFALLTALHQSYVEFFRIQIRLFHLQYLFDRDFMAASLGAAVSPRAMLLLATAIAAFLVARAAALRVGKLSRSGGAFVALTLLSLLAHNRNITYRVQWFVAENLQVSPLEHLYMQWDAQQLSVRLARADLDQLQALLRPASVGGAQDASHESLFSLLTEDASPASQNPLRTALQRSFRAAVTAQQKPVVLILLMESMRPAETGYFDPAGGPSLTPNLDALAATGLVFKQAYSTGSVTRGGQEAVFCGYLGSRNTSLMRGNGLARLTCLPDLLTAAAGPARPAVGRGEAFWYHGGDERFDGQGAYWREHGVTDLLSRRDFPASTPGTGWGVGDKAFLSLAYARLSALRSRSTADFLVGMALTITNHIPWDLPSDAGPEAALPRAGGHPSYATTAYADTALGQLIRQMQASSLWANTLLIVVSDHGTALPPLVDLYPQDPNAKQRLASHINFIVNGGILTTALQAVAQRSVTIDAITSQASVATLVADVVGLNKARFMADHPLSDRPTLPVLSDLEDELFDHRARRAYSHVAIARGRTGNPSLSRLTDASGPSSQTGWLYYRALLEYMNTPVGISTATLHDYRDRRD